MASLSTDLFFEILRHLDGPTLASSACACSTFRSISKEEKLWENVCSSAWPSTVREDVKDLISSIGGFRKFYADCYPLIVIDKEVCNYNQNDEHGEYPEEWTEAEFYGDMDELESVSPSDFVSIVDIRFKDKTICSKVLWGIPNANTSDEWFENCPFRIDILAGDATISDDLPAISSLERERKDGKLWSELRDNLHLSWIITNRRTKRSANLASWRALGGLRHWPTEKDFVVRFGSLLPAPCQVAECVVRVKFRAILAGGGVSTKLMLTEASLQLEDVESAHVNGRDSLRILRAALSCHRSRKSGEVVEKCRLYWKERSELREEKMRYENRLDRLCILGGIAGFLTLWYFIL